MYLLRIHQPHRIHALAILKWMFFFFFLTWHYHTLPILLCAIDMSHKSMTSDMGFIWQNSTIHVYFKWHTLWWTNIAMERSTMLLMGKSTISMAIVHCYVSSPEGNHTFIDITMMMLYHTFVRDRMFIDVWPTKSGYSSEQTKCCSGCCLHPHMVM